MVQIVVCSYLMCAFLSTSKGANLKLSIGVFVFQDKLQY